MPAAWSTFRGRRCGHIGCRGPGVRLSQSWGAGAGCRLSLITSSEADSPLPCNAVLSDMDGRIEAGWIFDRNDETVTEEHALSKEVFGMLWDGIAASLREGGIFRACLVTDPTRLIDPALYHVITTVQVRDGRVQYWTFMVPSGEADPVFTAWLEALAVPGGARAKERIPVRKLQAAKALQPGTMKTDARRQEILA